MLPQAERVQHRLWWAPRCVHVVQAPKLLLINTSLSSGSSSQKGAAGGRARHSRTAG